GVMCGGGGPREPADPEDQLTPTAIARLEHLVDTPAALNDALDELHAARVEVSLYDETRQLIASNVDPALAIPPWPPRRGHHPPGDPSRPDRRGDRADRSGPPPDVSPDPRHDRASGASTDARPDRAAGASNLFRSLRSPGPPTDARPARAAGASNDARPDRAAGASTGASNDALRPPADADAGTRPPADFFPMHRKMLMRRP